MSERNYVAKCVRLVGNTYEMFGGTGTDGIITVTDGCIHILPQLTYTGTADSIADTSLDSIVNLRPRYQNTLAFLLKLLVYHPAVLRSHESLIL